MKIMRHIFKIVNVYKENELRPLTVSVFDFAFLLLNGTAIGLLQ